MSESVTQLSSSLYNILQSENYVILNTVDAESGGPTASAISWIYAVNYSTLRFTIDHRSRLVRNLKENPLATVNVFGEDTIYAINGKVTVLVDPLPEVPFPMCCFELTIEAVRNALFYGAQLKSAPVFAKTYDQRASDLLDTQVFAAMRKAQER